MTEKHLPAQMSPPALQIADQLAVRFGLERVEPIYFAPRRDGRRISSRTYYQTRLNGKKVFIKYLGDSKGDAQKEFLLSNRLHRINENHFPEALFYSDDIDCRCIAFDCLEGEELLSRMKRADLTPSEKEKIILQFREVAKGLMESGITHRDIHPKNFFVTQDGTLKLIDFGCSYDSRRHAKQYAVSKNPALLLPRWWAGLMERSCLDDMFRMLEIIETIGCQESYRETYREVKAFFKEHLRKKPVRYAYRQLSQTGFFRRLREWRRNIKHRLKRTVVS